MRFKGASVFSSINFGATLRARRAAERLALERSSPGPFPDQSSSTFTPDEAARKLATRRGTGSDKGSRRALTAAKATARTRPRILCEDTIVSWLQQTTQEATCDGKSSAPRFQHEHLLARARVQGRFSFGAHILVLLARFSGPSS